MCRAIDAHHYTRYITQYPSSQRPSEERVDHTQRRHPRFSQESHSHDALVPVVYACVCEREKLESCVNEMEKNHGRNVCVTGHLSFSFSSLMFRYVSASHFSSCKRFLHNSTCVIGVDEAGRGFYLFSISIPPSHTHSCTQCCSWVTVCLWCCRVHSQVCGLEGNGSKGFKENPKCEKEKSCFVPPLS